MKTRHLVLVICLLAVATPSHAQLFKKLGKAAERAAERTIERRVETETTKSTDRALDTVIEAPKEKSKRRRNKRKKDKKKKNGNIIGGTTTTDDNKTSTTSQSSGGLEEVGSNTVNFKRGSRIIFSDAFEKDGIGDFPAKWNSNRGGEVKKLKGFTSNYLKIPAGSVVNVQLSKPLPENFTVECDIILPSEKQYRRAGIGFGDKPYEIHYLIASNGTINFDIYSDDSRSKQNPYTLNYSDKKIGNEKNSIQYKAPLNKAIKVAFEVNGKRIRMFVDDEKVVDLPTAFEPEYRKALFFNAITNNSQITKESYFYISNLVIAETASDERSGILKDLMEKGNFSTNAILFNSGSASIKSGSEAILQEIGEAMKTESTMRIMIVGHTDTDGDANSNLKLSSERAQAVRKILVEQYGINIGRIQTDGKGESQPIATNTTDAGKSQNRRVEFIKI